MNPIFLAIAGIGAYLFMKKDSTTSPKTEDKAIIGGLQLTPSQILSLNPNLSTKNVMDLFNANASIEQVKAFVGDGSTSTSATTESKKSSIEWTQPTFAIQDFMSIVPVQNSDKFPTVSTPSESVKHQKAHHAFWLNEGIDIGELKGTDSQMESTYRIKEKDFDAFLIENDIQEHKSVVFIALANEWYTPKTVEMDLIAGGVAIAYKMDWNALHIPLTEENAESILTTLPDENQKNNNLGIVAPIGALRKMPMIKEGSNKFFVKNTPKGNLIVNIVSVAGEKPTYNLLKAM